MCWCAILTMRNKRLLTGARYGLIYQVGARRPQPVLLPIRNDYDPACGSLPWPEDLNVDKWFGRQQRSVTLWEYPGSDTRLGNGFDIFFLTARGRRSHYGHPNDLVQALFSVDWRGNLLVVKRGCRERGSAVSITRPEIPLIGNFVEQ